MDMPLHEKEKHPDSGAEPDGVECALNGRASLEAKARHCSDVGTRHSRPVLGSVWFEQRSPA